MTEPSPHEKAKTVRLIISPKGNMAKSKVIKIPCDITLDQLLTIARQKFKGKWNRCSLKEGTTISDTSSLKAVIRDDLSLVFSYVGPEEVEEVKEPAESLVAPAKTSAGKVSLLFVKSKIESEAYHHLLRLAGLEGITSAIGFPNLHARGGFPIGCTLVSESGYLYPFILGEDPGCGISLVRTGIPTSKQKPKKWFKSLGAIEADVDPTIAAKFLQHSPFEWPCGVRVPVTTETALHKFGTLGHGAHFVEIQEVSHVVDPGMFKELGMSENELYLVVHTGGRAMGENLHKSQVKSCGDNAIKVGTQQCEEFVAKLERVVGYGKRNRAMVAYRMLSQLTNVGPSWVSDSAACVLDNVHNTIEIIKGTNKVIHRKGTVPSTQKAIVVPGSRGSYTFLLAPIKENAGYSLPNGAGRAMSRAKAVQKTKEAFPTVETLVKTEMEGYVICEDREVLYEQAPLAWKVRFRFFECGPNRRAMTPPNRM